MTTLLDSLRHWGQVSKRFAVPSKSKATNVISLNEHLEDAKVSSNLLRALQRSCEKEKSFLQKYGFRKGYADAIKDLDELVSDRLSKLDAEICEMSASNGEENKKNVIVKFEREQDDFSSKLSAIETRIGEIKRRAG